ncbi:DNA cytosine methyltransferase [Bacteroides sp.]|uniref:DNA cytosine methyltransferase n=1 Tax=Bacteroides sp. TaxID=29523 RepID=UPI00262B78DA|nr:DNA cytosine methyltransferase [Bacteroides sp.]MDD3039097.1 DNA cytosine methyltransferase [Bacteroides sp.]
MTQTELFPTHSDTYGICELFCGAGGMGSGFANHFTISQAIDIKPEAVQTYQANHPETQTIKKDISILSGATNDFTGITGIIGGPPCQAWSRRNIKQDPDDPRRLLVNDFMRLVSEIKPDFFVLENVVGTPKDIKIAISDQSKHLEYHTRSTCLKASDHGAAQTRPRWVVIGSKTKIPDIKKYPAITVNDAFSPITHNWGYMKSNITTVARFKTASTTDWQPMNGKYKNMIRLTGTTPAPTVVNPKKVYMIHPAEDRNITLAEAAALQGFPPDYIWKGTESQIGQMIANAMPSQLASAIAESISKTYIG